VPELVMLTPVMVEPLEDQFAVNTGSVAPDAGVTGELPPSEAVGWLMYEPPLPAAIVTLEICVPTPKVVLKLQALAPFPIVNVPVPPLYPLPGELTVIEVIFPVESVLTAPANPLPLPGGEAFIETPVLFFCFEHVPAGICTALIQPALLFMFTVALAFVMVLVDGVVLKLTVGVTPDA
jgi:hypothetical protein